MSPSSITRRRQAGAGLSLRRDHAWVAAGVLAVALGLAACGDPTRPLARAGAPDELEISIGGFAMGGSTVELRGDTVVLRRTPWDWSPDAAIDTVRAVPAPDSWRAFWAAAERAGVHRWRSRYAAEGVVDGVGWDVRIAAGGRLVESAGSNAYPDRFGREHELSMPDDFQAFLTAVGELVGQAVWF